MADELWSAQNYEKVNADLLSVEHLDDEYCKVDLVSYRDSQPTESSLFLRLDEETPILPLADGTEIAQCHTRDGQKVSIILGKPDEGEFQPARVVIGPVPD